jgi:NADPH:quinone reductase-like Zn-dependent oxidoreductase
MGGLAASIFMSLVQPAIAASADGALPSTTRKVVLEKAEKGFRWKLTESPVPTPGDNQVLIRVRAVALNRGDLEILDYDNRNDKSGQIVGSDAAGDVVAVGSKVKSVRKGARVTSTYFRDWVGGVPTAEKLDNSLGAGVDGVLGEYIVLDATSVVPMAAGLSYEEASTLPTAGLTGFMASIGRRELHKGDVVVVQGTGGVSLFAAQFASAAGGRVIVTSSSDEKIARAKKVGAQDGINYKSVPAWSARVLELTNQRGADVVVDVGGKDTLAESVKSLAFGGTLSIVGGITGYDGSVRAGALIGKSLNVQGIFVGSAADFARMNAFIAKHRLHPLIDHVYPFDQYQDALKQMQSGNFVGKLVIRF